MGRYVFCLFFVRKRKEFFFEIFIEVMDEKKFFVDIECIFCCLWF